MNRLKKLRKLKAMSQQELADQSGVGRVTVSRIERGEIVPHGRTVRKLAEALGVEPGELLEQEEKPMEITVADLSDAGFAALREWSEDVDTETLVEELKESERRYIWALRSGGDPELERMAYSAMLAAGAASGGSDFELTRQAIVRALKAAERGVS